MSAKFCVYLVRHGETDWNRTRKLQGQVDVPLNETGFKQSTSVGKALVGIPFVRAFSSDLLRATQTAERVLQHHSDIVLEKDERIRERRYLNKLRDDAHESGEQKPSAESMADFSARCLAWYATTVEKHIVSTVGGVPALHNIIVVSHGGWILTLLGALHAKGTIVFREGVDIGYCLNTGVSIIEYSLPNGGGTLTGTLIQYSGIEHLVRDDLIPLEVNEDVIGDEWRQG